MPGYNVQVAVEGTLQLIVREAVTQDTNDKRQLPTMVRTMRQQAGQAPAVLLADSGYCSAESLRYLAGTSIDAYIATRKMKHGERLVAARRGPIPRHATRVERMARKVQTQRTRRSTRRGRGSWSRRWGRSSRAAASAVSPAWAREGSC